MISFKLFYDHGVSSFVIPSITLKFSFMKFIPLFTKRLIAFFFLTTIVLVACKKDNGNYSNVDAATFATASSESDAESQTVFDDVFDNVVGTNDEVGMNGVGIIGRANNGDGNNVITGLNGTDSLVKPCFTISVTRLNPPDRFPLQIVIDFGSGCTGRDGRTRKGKIITVYTKRLLVPGAKATTTFDGYYINNIHVEGTHIIENISTSDKRIFHVQVIGAKLTKPNGNYTEWSSDKTIEQTDGLGTPLWPLDDVFSVTGQANGTLHRGNEFMQWSHIISKPLVKKFTCHWIVKGEVTIQKGSKPVAFLDFGNGDCDNKATITVNGVVHEITLY
jgi:hypothetical protein